MAGSGPTTAAVAPGAGLCAGVCVATQGIGVDVACDTGGWSVCVAGDGDVPVVVISLPLFMAARVGSMLVVPGRAAHTTSRTAAAAMVQANHTIQRRSQAGVPDKARSRPAVRKATRDDRGR